MLSLLHVVSNSLWLLLLSGSFEGLLSESLLLVFGLGTLVYSFYSWHSTLGFESKFAFHGFLINSVVIVILFTQISSTNGYGSLSWQFFLVFVYAQSTTTYFGVRILLKSLLANIGKSQKISLVTSSIVFIFLPIILVYLQHFATKFIVLNLGFFLFSFAHITTKKVKEFDHNIIIPLTSELQQSLKDYSQLSKTSFFGLSTRAKQIELYKMQLVECLERNRQLEQEMKEQSEIIEKYERRSENTVESILSEYEVTQRQLETVQLLVEGKSAQEIADELFIDYATVRSHLSAVYRKTGVAGSKKLKRFLQEQMK